MILTIRKESRNLSGIYVIKSPSGKMYIGSAVNLRKRFNLHKCCLENNKHHNLNLQKSFNRMTTGTFTFKVLELVGEIEDLETREQFYIDVMNPEFNSQRVATSCTGRIVTDETKDKIRKSIIKVRSVDLSNGEN